MILHMLTVSEPVLAPQGMNHFQLSFCISICAEFGSTHARTQLHLKFSAVAVGSISDSLFPSSLDFSPSPYPHVLPPLCLLSISPPSPPSTSPIPPSLSLPLPLASPTESLHLGCVFLHLKGNAKIKLFFLVMHLVVLSRSCQQTSLFHNNLGKMTKNPFNDSITKVFTESRV